MEDNKNKSEVAYHKTNIDYDFVDYNTFENKGIYNPLFFTKINGATLNQAKVNAVVGIGECNSDGWCNECRCTLEQGDKLGDFFDVLPYGVINKTITGIGATTLELNSKRDSIIVLPTKSIAYSKYKTKRGKDGDDSCMYVGSPIGEIKSDVTLRHIKDYITRDNGHKKFLVVADSLYKVLEAIGKDNYDNYFLMVDEIDTLQIDNSYRPVLEKVIDFYAKFKQTNRAVVSATLRGFTHPELLKETVITTTYPIQEKRDIKLIHTNNEDRCIVNTIKDILEEDSEANILVAYNSVESITICIKLLIEELGESINGRIGVLCSEKSKDKIDDYYIEVEDGELSRNIVFMTCAYFVGVDINTKCHIISVSSFRKPFTLLSKEKLTQIVGRCRPGALSETIIYVTKDTDIEGSISKYKDYLLNKASTLIKAVKAFKKTLDSAPELFSAANYVEDIIKHVGVEKIYNSYIPIIRENVDKELVPSYFNIDALLEKWALLHELYKEKDILLNELENEGHKVSPSDEEYEYTELQKKIDEIVRSTKAERIEQALQKAKEDLLELSGLDDSQKEVAFKKLHKNCTLELKKLFDNFEKLSPYYEAKYLVNLLTDHHNDDSRVYKKLINSLVFHALDDTHSFKVLVLGVFEYHKIGSDKSKANISPDMRRDKMKQIFETYFKGYKVNESYMNSLMLSIFKQGKTKKCFQITGLNPMDLEDPINTIKDMDSSKLFKTFIFD